MRKTLCSLLILTALIITGCSKKSETLTFDSINDFSLQVPGKQVTYKLDSLLYINFGTKDTTISYQVKDSVIDQVTDNLGRAAFRIFRYIRKNATDAWQPNNTFMVIPVNNTVEFVENNHRFLKLKQPLRDAFSWKGNTYVDTYSLNSDVKYMDDWDYIYQDLNQPLVLGPVNLDNTITVSERDETIGNVADVNSYSERNLSIEKYAKGIGLVYRNFLHREYQPPTPGGGGGYKLGYGVTMTMISHN